MSSGSKPRSQILEFFIFHRNGTCICHIDKIDNQLIPLLTERMELSKKVAQYKIERGIPVA